MPQNGRRGFQRPDGLFHDVVDDPSTFVETNLAQMLTYTLYRGTREGWLGAPCRAARVDAEGYVGLPGDSVAGDPGEPLSILTGIHNAVPL
jgi:rhamnogalacturonyl hydrolase YesR